MRKFTGLLNLFKQKKVELGVPPNVDYFFNTLVPGVGLDKATGNDGEELAPPRNSPPPAYLAEMGKGYETAAGGYRSKDDSVLIVPGKTRIGTTSYEYTLAHEFGHGYDRGRGKHRFPLIKTNKTWLGKIFSPKYKWVGSNDHVLSEKQRKSIADAQFYTKDVPYPSLATGEKILSPVARSLKRKGVLSDYDSSQALDEAVADFYAKGFEISNELRQKLGRDPTPEEYSNYIRSATEDDLNSWNFGANSEGAGDYTVMAELVRELQAPRIEDFLYSFGLPLEREQLSDYAHKRWSYVSGLMPAAYGKRNHTQRVYATRPDTKEQYMKRLFATNSGENPQDWREFFVNPFTKLMAERRYLDALDNFHKNTAENFRRVLLNQSDRTIPTN